MAARSTETLHYHRRVTLHSARHAGPKEALAIRQMRHCAQHRQASPRRRRAHGRLYLTVTSPMARSQQTMPPLRIQTRNLDCSAAPVLTTMLMSRGTRCNQKLAHNDRQADKISNLSARMLSETQSDTLALVARTISRTIRVAPIRAHTILRRWTVEAICALAHTGTRYLASMQTLICVHMVCATMAAVCHA